TLPAVAAGLTSGLVSITAGAPLYTSVSAAASGIIAGAAACLFTLGWVGRSRRQQWYVVGSHLVAGAVGIVLLGLTATNRGFLFTGGVGLISNQFVAAAIVAVYSAVVAALLWAVLRRITVRQRAAAEPVR
ncbi:MAG TPA: ammonium transporter, partial [Microbacterium sp.]|nr:ammonium transporter [Microbacterium sp.]